MDLHNLLICATTNQDKVKVLCPHLECVDAGVTELAANWLARILKVHK